MTNDKRGMTATGTDVCPDLVPVAEYGEHSSYVAERGVRQWVFDDPEVVERFNAAVRAGEFRRPRR